MPPKSLYHVVSSAANILRISFFYQFTVTTSASLSLQVILNMDEKDNFIP
jgi:hypothetical protein